MVEFITKKVSQYLVNEKYAKVEDLELIAYGLFHILSSILQIFVLIVVSVALGKTIQIVAYSLCFTMLKRYVGGAHANKHWVCLTSFTAMAVISCYCCELLLTKSMPVCVYLSIFFTIIVVLLKAPVQHYNNPLSPQKRLKMRKKSLLMLLIQSTALITLTLVIPKWADLYILCGSAGGLSAAITLIIPMRSDAKEVIS